MSTYTPIATQTLISAVSSVTFTNIPQDYTDLILVTTATTSVGGRDYNLRFNNDSSAIYSSTIMAGNGSGSGSSARYTGLGNTALYTLAGTSTTNPGIVITQLMNYSNSKTYKSIIQRGNEAAGEVVAGISLYKSTLPINRIDIYASTGSGNWNTGSTFSLYGIQAGTPKAQGGQIVTTDGTYWYHAFTASGTFTTTSAITADYLVIAGGGGGAGYAYGGGGGAGGLRSTVTATGGGGSLESALSLSANTTYSVIVGAGGAAGTGEISSQPAFNGNNSIFSTITSTGGGKGGGGAGTANQNGGNGGSGGGAGGNAGATAGTRVVGQGYAGGSGATDSATYADGGGGGGAGAVGGNAAVNQGGTGGAGVLISALATPTNTGVSGYYAGGGGGGGTGGEGSGGSGGGGGASESGGTAGTANTGSGGGSAGGSTAGSNGGNGGSGLVIVRYAV